MTPQAHHDPTTQGPQARLLGPRDPMHHTRGAGPHAL